MNNICLHELIPKMVNLCKIEFQYRNLRDKANLGRFDLKTKLRKIKTIDSNVKILSFVPKSVYLCAQNSSIFHIFLAPFINHALLCPVPTCLRNRTHYLAWPCKLALEAAHTILHGPAGVPQKPHTLSCMALHACLRNRTHYLAWLCKLALETAHTTHASINVNLLITKT